MTPAWVVQVVYMATAGSVVREGRPQCSKFERVISGAFHNRQKMSCAGLEIHSVLTVSEYYLLIITEIIQ
jgi:hypothetical protein